MLSFEELRTRSWSVDAASLTESATGTSMRSAQPASLVHSAAHFVCSQFCATARASLHACVGEGHFAMHTESVLRHSQLQTRKSPHAPPNAPGSVPSAAAPSAEHFVASQSLHVLSDEAFGGLSVAFLHVLSLSTPPSRAPDEEPDEEPDVPVPDDVPLHAVMRERAKARKVKVDRMGCVQQGTCQIDVREAPRETRKNARDRGLRIRRFTPTLHATAHLRLETTGTRPRPYFEVIVA